MCGKKICSVKFICRILPALYRRQNSPYFCLFKYARAVKQKVWNEVENRERDWGETLRTRFTDFFTDFEKKNSTVLQSMHCINYAKREQEKPLLFKLLQGHVSHYHELNLHKLRKKLANQKRQYMSLGLCGIRTRYCALLRRRSIQDV